MKYENNLPIHPLNLEKSWSSLEEFNRLLKELWKVLNEFLVLRQWVLDKSLKSFQLFGEGGGLEGF